MASNARTVRIEWGDCDPAGIVFYPRYFAMFDHSTTLMIERTLGMSKHQLQETHGFVGYPVVETRSRFLQPSRFGDDVVIETSLTAVRRSSFDITHRLSRCATSKLERCTAARLVSITTSSPNRVGARNRARFSTTG